MLNGKTKQGVLLRSTLGMRTVKPVETWMLVADRSKVRLFERMEQPEGHTIELIRSYENPDGRKHGRDLVADRPGRSFESQDRSRHGQSGPTRHSYGDSFQPETHVVEGLVAEAVKIVGDFQLNSPKVHLYILAEPSLMGLLRPALLKALPKAEAVFLEKDYAWLKTAEVEERLKDLIP